MKNVYILLIINFHSMKYIILLLVPLLFFGCGSTPAPQITDPTPPTEKTHPQKEHAPLSSPEETAPKTTELPTDETASPEDLDRSPEIPNDDPLSPTKDEKTPKKEPHDTTQKAVPNTKKETVVETIEKQEQPTEQIHLQDDTNTFEIFEESPVPSKQSPTTTEETDIPESTESHPRTKEITDPKTSIYPILKKNEHFDAFVGLLEEHNLTNVLTENPSLTVFAPVDEFFEPFLENEDVQKAFGDDVSTIMPIFLLSSITAGELSIDDLLSYDALEVLSGIPLFVHNYDGLITLNDQTHILGEAFTTSNGLIYPVDSLIMPLTPEDEIEN